MLHSDTGLKPLSEHVFLKLTRNETEMNGPDLNSKILYTVSTTFQVCNSLPPPPLHKTPLLHCSDLPPPAKQPSTDIQLQHQTPVQQYASYLKSVYTIKKAPIYRWPPVKSKKYINLALIEKEDITKREADQFTRATIHGNIDDIKKSKRAIDIGQIAQLPDGSHPKCILVEGAPGVGKSTFAWNLCRKWGKGKLLQQYQLVVLLRLRDKSVQTALNISDLFRYHVHQIQQAAVEEIQRTWGKGVLLLFDGYEQLPEELRTKNSIFQNVITGVELPEATVLVTSRPWASQFFHRKYISQHIEILGFTKDNIQSYLDSTIPNDPSLLADLKKYISCYPHIGSLMYIPLNSAIVVEVYRNSRKEETLVPKTMTELYSSLVRSLLLRHLLDHPVHGKKRKWRVRSFDDLPQDVYQQLCELGKIAYEGILHDQQVIFSDLPEDFETLGLMQCVRELYVGEGAAVSYNFLHLTVQEYLAAFHLSRQPVEKQIEHFVVSKQCPTYHHKEQQLDTPFHMVLRSMSHHEQQQLNTYFHMVLRFLCGVGKFSEYPSKVLNTLCVEESVVDDDSDGKSGDDPASVVRKVTFDTLHWLFEAQDESVIAKVLELSDIQPQCLRRVTPFDCFVLGYCVSHSNCTWRIYLEGCYIGDEGVEMLVRGVVEEETHCTGGISEINLMGNNITSEGVKQLLGFSKQVINKLKTLSLVGNKLDSEPCAALMHLIPHVPHLKKLDLSYNPNIGQGGTVPLITSLTSHNSLEKLVLEGTEIGVEDCQALSELLSSSRSPKKLNIGGNDLPPEAVELIISGPHHNTTLERLIMWGSHFSLQNTISLASVLRTNHTLVHLNLAVCDIDSDGACQLASALCTNDTLQELGLSGNPVGVEGATAVAKMLHTNKSLKMLSIRDDSMGEEGTKKLIDSLAHNTTMKELKLPKNKSSIAKSKVDSRVIVEL